MRWLGVRRFIVVFIFRFLVLAAVTTAPAALLSEPTQAQAKRPDATAAPSALPAARLGKATLPAAGRSATSCTISRFGRYAVSVESKNGTALRIVDRMAGPGDLAGKVGEEDGRLDVFLDQGEYRVLTYGHQQAGGTVRIHVRPFVERNVPQAPKLIEFKPVDSSLADLEQRSYWLEIEKRQPVALEAAGRNLADLRLWKDGNWLVDAEPVSEIVQPVVGQPLRVCRLSAKALNPGLYLLTAYGGPGQPWAEDRPQHSFHLRFGIPQLGAAGRRRYTVGPFGFDRFRVPGSATYFRIELPEAREATLEVATFNPDDPFRAGGTRGDVTKKSLPPVAEVSAGGTGDADSLVTVTGAAGQPYILQHFERRPYYTFNGSGEYWVSTVPSGYAGDSVDATAIVTRSGDRDRRHVEPLLADVVDLGPGRAYSRRANLLSQLTVFFRIRESGSYEVLGAGTEARFRIEPFMTDRPAGYQIPQFRGSGSKWDLDAGYHVLTAEPVRKGILELTIRPSGIVDTVLSKIGMGPDASAEPIRSAVRFPKVRLAEGTSYELYLNERPEVRTGMILRRLPMALTDPLAVVQRPGEEVSVPFQVDRAGTLRADAEDGSRLPVSLDNGLPKESQDVGPGTHTASVRLGGKETLSYSLLIEPLELQVGTPLPPLPDSALASLPRFPVLGSAAPQMFDLNKQENASFLVHAEKSALYRLETTGLLATAGHLRTKTVTSFLGAEENGVGRNFLIQDYLREGNYQVTVATKGDSAGHLGISLSKTSLIDGGVLVPGTPARMTLPPGEAVVYRFRIDRADEYRLEALGLNRTYRCRLEDDRGWPIEKPNIEARLKRRFTRGSYRLIILPTAVGGRAVTILEPTPRPALKSGHGPHQLPLAQRVQHQWLEPEGEGERKPDVFDVDLPAPATISIELTSEMQGTLLRVGADGSTQSVGFVPPSRGWKGELEAGLYRIEAVSSRRNNRVTYQLAFWPEQLVAGLSREVSTPAEIPVSVGKPGLVELTSFGSADVRARLLDERGQLVAANDDRPDDWNFAIESPLPAGRYRLLVDPAGQANARCTVAMTVPPEVEKPALAPPARIEVKPGRNVLILPVDIPAGAELLLLAAASGESVGLAVETRTASGAWIPVGSSLGRMARVEVPLRATTPQAPATYRLRLWSADRRDTPVNLEAVAITPMRLTEKELAAGAPLPLVSGLKAPTGAVAVTLDRPGLLRVGGSKKALRFSAVRDEACQESVGGLVPASESVVYLVGDLPDGKSGSASVKAARVELATGPEEALTLQVPASRDVACDLKAAAEGPKGPVLVFARSLAGQPGVRIEEQDRGGNPDSSPAMALGPGAAVSVSLSTRKAVAHVYSAGVPRASIEVVLTRIGFASAPREGPRPGSWEGSLTGLKGRSFDLPTGPKQIRLALGEGLVAVLSKGDEVTSVHWNGGEAFEETVQGTPDRLTLLHTRSEEDRFSAELIPLAAKDLTPPLAPGASYERAYPSAGAIRLEVAPQPRDGDRTLTLHVRGAREEPLLIGLSGEISRGTDLPVGPAGGTLLIRHAPGLILAWVDRPGSEAEDLWSRGPMTTTPVDPPASIRLDAPATALRLTSKDPVLLKLRAASPSVTLLRRGEAPPEVEIHPSDTLLDAYLPAGTADLQLRAVAGGALGGRAELTTTPVTPIGEGLGPEVLLAAGETRLYSFQVDRKGPVGIGVRASADVVKCVLLSSSGRRLGSGVTQLSHLTPGTYLLALTAPSDGNPVKARPALAGLKQPDTGPPEEVVRSYTAPEAESPGFTSRVAPAARPVLSEDDGEPDEENTEDEVPRNQARETPGHGDPTRGSGG
jgi:hypothetical protein